MPSPSGRVHRGLFQFKVDYLARFVARGMFSSHFAPVTCLNLSVTYTLSVYMWFSWTYGRIAPGFASVICATFFSFPRMSRSASVRI